MPLKRTDLTQTECNAITEPGRHRVAKWLYLRVQPNGGRSWVAELPGRKFVKIADFDRLTLKKAQDALLALLRNSEVRTKKRTATERITFAKAADEYLEGAKRKWKIPEDKTISKQEERYISIVTNHLVPKIGSIPVLELTPRDCADALKPIWYDKWPTAKKARQFMERIIFSVIAQTGTTIANPSDLKLMKAILSEPDHEAEHHKAPTVEELRAVLDKLSYKHVTHYAFAWMCASCARTGSVRYAAEGQINKKTKSWDIPAEYTKMNKVFRVPMTTKMKELQKDLDGRFFENANGNVISADALRMFCKKRKLDWTPHGVRSTFRSWCQRNKIEWQVAEMCIDHQKRSDEVESPYARDDILEVRREIMEKWDREIFG